MWSRARKVKSYKYFKRDDLCFPEWMSELFWLLFASHFKIHEFFWIIWGISFVFSSHCRFQVVTNNAQWGTMYTSHPLLIVGILRSYSRVPIWVNCSCKPQNFLDFTSFTSAHMCVVLFGLLLLSFNMWNKLFYQSNAKIHIHKWKTVARSLKSMMLKWFSEWCYGMPFCV